MNRRALKTVLLLAVALGSGCTRFGKTDNAQQRERGKMRFAQMEARR